jgi:hypothetical protein
MITLQGINDIPLILARHFSSKLYVIKKLYHYADEIKYFAVREVQWSIVESFGLVIRKEIVQRPAAAPGWRHNARADSV